MPVSKAELTGGITAGYDDEGHGTSVVLVHGHPFDRTMWQPQVRHLARGGHRVLAPDLRGYGTSTVVPGKTTLETFARDLAALLDRQEPDGADGVVLGGLSMGGQIVMEFLRLFPERVRALVLADTSAPAESAAGRRERLATADRLEREGMGPYAEEVLDRMVTPQNQRDLPEVAGHVRRMMHDAPPEGAAAALRGRAERPDYTATLRAARVPALVVVGEEDAFTPLADARLLHDALAGSELVVVEGAGHLPNLERPEAFNAALDAFLARLPRPAETV
ncbi:alpha/beta fold hydrolase [Streptomyces sp. JJ36]|uniref:alpha/beta fold hydrolase n=1 Tax=Streptomyces sp. JJ36 TaxID=2736645 RepID=UPI001F238B25|nr:alpha/beta hydrolase [Streptomyces sp. JJ36]MCF6525751.1 alpha/beta fold hydrolase [Streptomyces sp. JJ36]